ncbi:MAG: hypothetical protein HRT61_15980 [Ekhidna sp.]|nr:hypothetical protein [Ekhidna sp.]
MSSFRESFRKAMEQAEKQKQENTGVVVHLKFTPSSYLLVSSGILAFLFLLIVFVGPHTLLSSDYRTVRGQFQKEDLVYMAGDQMIVHEDDRDFGYSYKKRSGPRKASNGRRFQWQVISYKKENPKEFVYAFGLHGNLSDISNPTLHNFLLIGLILLAILNLLFARWASSKKAKRFMEKSNEAGGD